MSHFRATPSDGERQIDRSLGEHARRQFDGSCSHLSRVVVVTRAPSELALHCHQFIVRFPTTDSKRSGSLPQHDSCTANPSGMIKNGRNVVSPFTAISSVQTAQ